MYVTNARHFPCCTPPRNHTMTLLFWYITWFHGSQQLADLYWVVVLGAMGLLLNWLAAQPMYTDFKSIMCCKLLQGHLQTSFSVVVCAHRTAIDVTVPWLLYILRIGQNIQNGVFPRL